MSAPTPSVKLPPSTSISLVTLVNISIVTSPVMGQLIVVHKLVELVQIVSRSPNHAPKSIAFTMLHAERLTINVEIKKIFIVCFFIKKI